MSTMSSRSSAPSLPWSPSGHAAFAALPPPSQYENAQDGAIGSAFISKCTGWIMKEDDTPQDTKVKRALTPVLMVVLPLCVYWLVAESVSSQDPLYLVAFSLYIIGCVQFMALGMYGNNMKYAIWAFVALLTVGTVCHDLYAASRGAHRPWGFVVLYLDITLLFNVTQPVPAVLSCVFVYLTLERAEAAFRFGLYDARGSAIPPVCNCSDPPCSIGGGEGISTWVGMLFVILVDFHITRGFASDLRLQVRKVQSLVHVTTEVAAALAKYNVDAAEKAISGRQDLPEELRRSYMQLMLNLRVYRDYLPDALMNFFDGDVESTPVHGMPRLVDDKASMGMVFTDIQSSTLLWEAFPRGMYEALQVHNTTLRAVAGECQGYEVKVIGDAFMLAFGSANNAVQFGVVAQERLVQSEWPPSLCDHPLCQRGEGPNGVVLWHGVRVRIGINWGAVEAEKNPVTGRYDFFGATVNTAARVEAALKHGGLTGVTQAVMEECPNIPTDFFTTHLGEKVLKGVARPVAIHVVLSHALAARLSELNGDTDSNRVSVTSQSPAVDISYDDVPRALSGCNLAWTGDQQQQALRIEREPPRRKSGMSAIVRLMTLDTPGECYPPQQSHTFSQLSNGMESPDQLAPSMATCVTVRGCLRGGDSQADAESVVKRMLVAIETAALRTQGQVMGVMSAVFVTAWNAGVRCPDHVAQAACFLTFISEGLPAPASSCVSSPRAQLITSPSTLRTNSTNKIRFTAHTGMATGRVLSGGMSGTRRRHLTVVGGSVELSIDLAQTAALLNLPFMATGAVGAHLNHEGVAVSVEVWTDPQAGTEIVWGPAKSEGERTSPPSSPPGGREYVSSFWWVGSEAGSQPTGGSFARSQALGWGGSLSNLMSRQVSTAPSVSSF
eukprot:Hpha_TRINITY_DN16679_c2_g11::TRINITY_DN16679_c2_g11_i1::g.181096::m.181096